MKRENLTKAQRWKLADKLAKDRLPLINKNLEPVVPADGLYARYGKRALDIIIAGSALIVTIPINAALVVGTFIDVGKPIFFRQTRTGRFGKPFELFKVRSMRNTRDERGELLPASQRVTKFGTFVRKTSLDELLNLVPVLKGDMSMIGPRPLPPEYLHRYNARHKGRVLVRPGLECPPRERLGHVWTWQESLDNDVWYVENVSFLTDCKMALNLVRFAFDAKSAEARAKVSSRGTFMGYDLDGNAINVDGVPQEYIDALDEDALQQKGDTDGKV